MKKIFSLIVLSFIFLPLVFGATTPNTFVYPQTPNIAVVQFLQGTDAAGTYKTVYTGNANGSRVLALWANTNDASAAHVVTCQIKTGAVLYGGTSVNVPINSGFATGVPPVNLMSTTNWPGLPTGLNSNPYFYLPSASYLLVCTFATALTSSDVLNVEAVIEDY